MFANFVWSMPYIGKFLAGENWWIWQIMIYLPIANIHRYTENVLDSAIAFVCMVHQNFTTLNFPHQTFPIYSNWPLLIFNVIWSQLYVEYTNVAVKGAVAAVDGNIPPINCSEHVKYVHTYAIMPSDWLFLFLVYTGNACSSGITYFSHLPLMVVTTTLMLVVSYCNCVNCVYIRIVTKTQLNLLTCKRQKTGFQRMLLYKQPWYKNY